MEEKKGTQAGEAAIPFGFDAMLEMQRPALAAMAQLNSRLYANLAAANQEWASFVGRRLKEDFAVPQQLAECRTIEDLYRVYSEFFQNAYSQYQSGLEQMTRLGKSLAETTFHSLQGASGQGSPTQH